MLGVLGLIAAPASEAHAEAPVLIDRIVAVVDDAPIYRSDVVTRARPLLSEVPEAEKQGTKLIALYREMLEKMIDDTLIATDAERLHLTVADEEVDRAIDAIAGGNKISRAELEAAVKKTGLSQAEYKEEIRREVLNAKWAQFRVRNRIKPPPADPKATDADREKAMMAALEVERRKALAELREHSFVEVRW